MSEGLQEKISPYVLGIDLGTSTSIVSVYRKGKPQVIRVYGEEVTPSVVNYRADSDPLIGVQAKRRALIDPDNTVVSIKRHMGDPEYKRQINEKDVKPEEVSALVLEYLKNGVQEHEDLLGTVKYAVITIPANFNNNQRGATIKAAELAGLEVKQLVEEPVAAAIGYGFGYERDQTILVYDLGGGTFDVCILKVDTSDANKPSFKVLGKAGVPKLGGDDFDEAVMKILAQAIVEQGGPDVLDEKKDQGVSKKKLRTAQQILKEEAEKVKIELSDAESAAVDYPNLVKNENGQDFHLSTTITREQFNEAIRPLVEQSGDCIKQALEEAKVAIDDVDRIILVGGSTRVPVIRTMITDMFGKEPYGNIDPATAVSQGAAILSATFELPGEKPAEDKITEEIGTANTTSHFLGIETVGQRFNAVLDKNVEIPCTNKKSYATHMDNQDEIRVTVFQFPVETKDIDMSIAGSACLGEFHLSPLEKLPAGKVIVEVEFNIDENGLLTVKANSSGSGPSKELTVKVT